jgi:hypothetical protein
MIVESLVTVQFAGLLAIVGALLYAVGDVLLLAVKVDLADYPRLQAHAKLLSGMEKMAALPSRRLLTGGLLGVFSASLLLAGYWQVYQGLLPAGMGWALPPLVLFVCSTVVGAFLHGSFIYLGEYVQALNRLEGEHQQPLLEMIARHRKIMVITYGFLMACILIASIWYSILVATGRTLFPQWMALVNPVTAFLAWALVKRILPSRIRDLTEGAGFNIAYVIFFSFTTWALWGVA